MVVGFLYILNVCLLSVFVMVRSRKLTRIRWVGHLLRTDVEMAKEVLNARIEEKRREASREYAGMIYIQGKVKTFGLVSCTGYR